MTSLRTESFGPVDVVTIDRPSAHNALDRDVLKGLLAAVERAEASPAVRAVVITGSGEKAFSAGADLKELAGMDADRAHAAIATGQATINQIAAASVPVIAAVNGLALGGGFELALAATFPLLSERASLGLPETTLGLVPGYGGTQRLPRAVGPQVSAHLMLTGARLDAARAYTLGLTPLPPVAPELLLDAALEVAGAMARSGPKATSAVLRALRVSHEGSLGAGLGVELGLAALAIAGEESTEGISAFLDRRPPAFAVQAVSA